MTDQFDLLLVEDGEGNTELAYAISCTTIPGDLVLLDGVVYEVMNVVESVPEAVIELLNEAGTALMVERIYTLSWDKKKGAVNNA